MQIGKGDGKYLGLPCLMRRSKRDIFAYLKEIVLKKTYGSKEKLLSQGGEEILIKFVLQTIPMYAMSVYHLPIGLCKELTSIIKNFFVGIK